MTTVGLVFVLLVVYQLKHWLADYLLRGRYMLGKFKGGWDWVLPLGAHVGMHALGTFWIAAFTFRYAGHNLDALAWVCVWLGLLDAGIHFIMDRIKASPKLLGRFKALSAPEYIQATIRSKADVGDTYFEPTFDERVHYTEDDIAGARRRLRSNVLFWWSLGFDQMVHHLTHYALIYLMLRSMGMVP